MYHNFFIHLSFGGLLGYFCVIAVVNSAASEGTERVGLIERVALKHKHYHV